MGARKGKAMADMTWVQKGRGEGRSKMEGEARKESLEESQEGGKRREGKNVIRECKER